jgi:hypothetical protein
MKISCLYPLFVEIGEIFARDELCVAWNPLYFKLNIRLLLTGRLETLIFHKKELSL